MGSKKEPKLQARKHNHKSLVLLAVLILLLPLLAACGSPVEAPQAAATTAPTAAQAAQATVAEPAGGAATAAATQAEGAATGTCENTAATKLIEQTANMTGKAREDFLVKQAAETNDGTVNFYGELGLEEAGPIVDGFEEKYGDLTVQYFRAPSDQIRQRILEESKANFTQGADLIELEALEMFILNNENLLTKASSPLAKDVEEAGQGEFYTADRFSYIAPAWNTKKIAKVGPPKSLEDLTDPKYKGMLALEDSDVYWFAVLVKHLQETEGMTEEQAIDLFRRIAANSAITHGHTTTAELLAAGQYGVSPNMYVHRIESLKGDKAPLEWKPAAAPIVAEITAVAMMCSARNPAGAMLLQDYMLSPDGAQKVFLEEERTPANAELGAKAYGDLNPISADVATIIEEYEKWSTTWEDVLRSGEKVE